MHLYGFAPFKVESHHGSHVLSLLFVLPIQQLLVFPYGSVEERAVKGYHKEVFKGRPNTAVVFRRIAHDTPLLGYKLNIRTAIAGIYHHIRTVAAVKPHSKCRCPFGGRKLHVSLGIT